MKHSLAHLFLFTALSMLWLHMVVPHAHVKSAHAGLEHELQEMDDSGLLSVLEKVFHVDLGTDHLSNFNKVRTLDVDNLLFLVALLLSVYTGWQVLKRPSLLTFHYSYASLLFAADVNSRPPPFLK